MASVPAATYGSVRTGVGLGNREVRRLAMGDLVTLLLKISTEQRGEAIAVATNGRGARARLATAVAVALAATALVTGCSSGSSSDGGGATDPVIASIASRMATAVSNRLGVMDQVAWVKYDDKSSVEDPRSERIQTQAFIKATAQAGVPKDVATATIEAQLEAGKSVQRLLIQRWATGVTPPPTGLPPNLATDVAPTIAEYTADIASGMRQLQVQGVPEDWSAIMATAADEQAPNLDAYVPRATFDQALAPIASWPPPQPEPTETPKQEKSKKAKKNSSQD